MNEPDRGTKNFCKEPVIAEDLYLRRSLSPLPNKLLLKSYISSRNRKFVSIFSDVGSYLLEKELTTTETKNLILLAQ